MLPVPLCLVPMLPESSGDRMNNTEILLIIPFYI